MYITLETFALFDALTAKMGFFPYLFIYFSPHINIWNLKFFLKQLIPYNSHNLRYIYNRILCITGYCSVYIFFWIILYWISPHPFPSYPEKNAWYLYETGFSPLKFILLKVLAKQNLSKFGTKLIFYIHCWKTFLILKIDLILSV